MRPWLTTWRLSLIAVVVGFWPQWVRLIARVRSLDLPSIELLAGQRWNVAIVLLAVELILVQDLIGRTLEKLLAP